MYSLPLSQFRGINYNLGIEFCKVNRDSTLECHPEGEYEHVRTVQRCSLMIWSTQLGLGRSPSRGAKNRISMPLGNAGWPMTLGSTTLMLHIQSAVQEVCHIISCGMGSY